ncbi:Uncharacterised protein [Mycobacteroides abscessus subsp. abscessus]|nr:Uncharacterised protein [Mycobacteroides abscessus subsp. abscessus]
MEPLSPRCRRCGSARAALADRARVLHHQLTEHGVGMQEFTGQVVAMDDLNADQYGQGR